MRRPAAGGDRAPALIGLAFGLLVLAWVVANPPFASPDEPDHYLRAIGLAGGEVLGRPARVDPPPDATPELEAWYRERASDVRSIEVPAGLVAVGVTCNALRSDVSASCLEEATPISQPSRQPTLVARYEPMPYLLPGAAIRVAGTNPFAALRIGRAASAVVCVTLLLLALALLSGREAPLVSVVGLAAAVTPTVVFVWASLNPSGLEIAAGIAFFAALLRLARGDGGTWPWTAAAVAGTLLALSRSTGPFWLVLDVLLVGMLLGLGGVRAAVRHGGLRARAALIALAAASLASLLWSVAYGPKTGFEVDTFVHRLRAGVGVLPLRLEEEIGRFGWLDAPMPELAVLTWQAMVIALVAVAFVVGGRAERRTLAAATVAALAVPVLYSAWFSGLTLIGDVQGRHVLPFVVVLPLLAGEIAYRNRERLRALRALGLAAAVPVLAAFVHAVGWFANGRRHAVGTDGPAFFLRTAEWSPPLGWWTWSVVVAASAAMLALAGVLGGSNLYPARSR